MGKEDLVPIKYEHEDGWGYITKAITDGNDEEKNWLREIHNYKDGETVNNHQGYQYRKSDNFPMTCTKLYSGKHKKRD